ncbi:hypothetical protein EHM76_07830 [bacterium]|nr:MAG: hypothetical protein EHM76_07830 [bacterium]
MVLNKFYINVLIRIIFIVLSCVALGMALQIVDRGYYYTLTGIIFLILLQTWLLVNRVNKTNRDLEKFFSSVQDHDTSIRFSENANDHSFRKLHDRMNHLNTIIQHVKIKNERSSHFLQNLVDHVDIGLLSFDMNGRIEIYNKAAIRYLNVREPQQLSSLGPMNEEIVEILNTIKPGQEILHKIKIDNLLQRILIKATELKFESNIIRLGFLSGYYQ